MSVLAFQIGECPRISQLTAIGGRSLLPATTQENESSKEITLTVGDVSATLPESVKSLLAPLFVLFDFKEIGDSVYENIVRRFENGECS